MTTINLKDFYYWYTQDQFIEVSGEVAEVFVSDARHLTAKPHLSSLPDNGIPMGLFLFEILHYAPIQNHHDIYQNHPS